MALNLMLQNFKTPWNETTSINGWSFCCPKCWLLKSLTASRVSRLETPRTAIHVYTALLLGRPHYLEMGSKMESSNVRVATTLLLSMTYHVEGWPLSSLFPCHDGTLYRWVDSFLLERVQTQPKRKCSIRVIATVYLQTTQIVLRLWMHRYSAPGMLFPTQWYCLLVRIRSWCILRRRAPGRTRYPSLHIASTL